MRRLQRLIAICALACGACISDASSPVKAVALAWSPLDHDYVLGPVQLSTLTSLRHLRGGAGSVQTGGAVRAARASIAARGATVEQLRGSLVTSAPGDVDLAFSISGGVAYPEDADALQLVTAFYNLEQARAAFNGWGLQTLPPAVLVAGATIAGDDGHSPLAHAELYFQPLETHYLPQPDRTTQIPVAMNQGAMAHSLMHQAVALQVWANAPLPATDAGDPKDPAWNSAKHAARSMTEGLADYMGYSVTGDPRWLDHSDQADAQARALDQFRCGSPEMLQALPLDDTNLPYDPYPLGAVLSTALWTAGEATQQEPVARAALAALPRIKAAALAGGGKLGVADVLEALAASLGQTNSDALPVLCGLVLDRFSKLSVDSLPSCNAVAPVKPSTLCNCQPGAPGCG